MDTTTKKTPLRQAVDYLIAIGKLNADKDLQEIFGLSKGTISKYLSETPGKEFLRDFQTKFEIEVANLPELKAPIHKESAKEPATPYRDKYEALLEKTNAEHVEYLNKLDTVKQEILKDLSELRADMRQMAEKMQAEEPGILKKAFAEFFAVTPLPSGSVHSKKALHHDGAAKDGKKKG